MLAPMSSCEAQYPLMMNAVRMTPGSGSSLRD